MAGSSLLTEDACFLHVDLSGRETLIGSNSPWLRMIQSQNALFSKGSIFITNVKTIEQRVWRIVHYAWVDCQIGGLNSRKQRSFVILWAKTSISPRKEDLEYRLLC